MYGSNKRKENQRKAHLRREKQIRRILALVLACCLLTSVVVGSVSLAMADDNDKANETTSSINVETQDEEKINITDTSATSEKIDEAADSSETESEQVQTDSLVPIDENNIVADSGEEESEDDVAIDSSSEEPNFFVANGVSNSLTAGAVSNIGNGTTVRCFVSNGSEWVQIDQYKESKIDSSSSRVYSYASELESVFGTYGFSASAYNGAMNFPQTDTEAWTDNPTNYIWFDSFATKDITTGDYHIWMTKHSNQTVDLFYMPKVTALKYADIPSNYLDAEAAAGSAFAGAALRTNTDLLTDNKFDEIQYNIHVMDTNGYFSDTDNSPVRVESVTHGNNITITLPMTNGVTDIEWTVYDQNGGIVSLTPTSQNTDSATVTYTLSNVNQSYSFNATTAEDVETVLCYVSINGEWKQVGVLTTSKTDTLFRKTRYYVTADELEGIFGKYGFSVDQLSDSGNQNQNVLPHNTEGANDKIWFDAPPTKNGDEWRIWVSNKKDPVTPTSYLFYTPGVSGLTISGGATTSDAAMVGSEFYTINASDPFNIFEGQQLPDELIVKKGESGEITLPYSETNKWFAIDNNGEAITNSTYKSTISDDRTTITYTFENVTQRIRLIADANEHMVQYVTTLDGQIQGQATGFEASAEAQSVYKDGTINGVVNPDKIIVSDDSYTVLSTDSDTAWSIADKIEKTKQRKYIYTFKGWLIDGTKTIIQPGTVLSRTDLLKYTNNEGVVKLIAQWNSKLANNLEQSINFYVRLDCEVIDNLQNGVVATPGSQYTKSIYTTRLTGIEHLNRQEVVANATENLISGFKLIESETAESAYDIDAKIKGATTTPIEYSDAKIGTASLMMESLPSDEDIMSEVRQQVLSGAVTIQIDGQVIPANMITSTNYTVRWYVVKYSKADGWHVDGVLVAKAGHIVVTKTFAGDNAAINEVKKDFNITVAHDDNTSDDVITDYTLTLNSSDAETRDGMTGYTSFDEATNTYTWVLVTRQERTYQIAEHNYALDTSINESGEKISWNSSHSYQISDSPNGIDTDGWIAYDPSASISVTATAYASDVPTTSYQTVAFQNIYVQGGLLTVQKIDTTTGHGLANVQFKISQADGESLTLYYNAEKNLYSTNPDKKVLAGWEEPSDSIITTDANGMFFIELTVKTDEQQAEYVLKETIPLGYDGPTKITVKVDDHGKVTMASAVTSDTSTEAPGGSWLEGENTFMLTIKNHSKRILTLTATKNWGATAEDKQRPVKVQLMRNGTLLEGDEYTQELSTENDWKCTWTNLPLFVDGKTAQYAVREVFVGDTAYDPIADGKDGYADYEVTYLPVEYWAGDNADATNTNSFWMDEKGEYQFADHAKIGVNNALNTSEFSFTKLNESGKPLSGAEFTVWKSLDDLMNPEKAVKVVSSDANGVVNFGELNSGIYYIYETKAPAGYNDMFTECLKVTVSNGIAKAEWWDLFSDEASEEPFNGYVTNYSDIQLTIRKFDYKNQSKLLPDAEFTIYKDNELFMQKSTSSEEMGYGTIILDRLEEGDYMIEETKAPSGYDLLAEGITIRVTNGKIVILGNSDKTHWKLTKDANNNNIYILDVFDNSRYSFTADPLFVMPSTGNFGLGKVLNTGIVALGVGVFGIVFTSVKIKRKK